MTFLQLKIASRKKDRFKWTLSFPPTETKICLGMHCRLKESGKLAPHILIHVGYYLSSFWGSKIMLWIPDKEFQYYHTFPSKATKPSQPILLNSTFSPIQIWYDNAMTPVVHSHRTPTTCCNLSHSDYGLYIGQGATLIILLVSIKIYFIWRNLCVHGSLYLE